MDLWVQHIQWSLSLLTYALQQRVEFKMRQSRAIFKSEVHQLPRFLALEFIYFLLISDHLLTSPRVHVKPQKCSFLQRCRSDESFDFRLCRTDRYVRHDRRHRIETEHWDICHMFVDYLLAFLYASYIFFQITLLVPRLGSCLHRSILVYAILSDNFCTCSNYFLFHLFLLRVRSQVVVRVVVREISLSGRGITIIHCTSDTIDKLRQKRRRCEAPKGSINPVLILWIPWLI